MIVETEGNQVTEVLVGREVRQALLDLLDRLVNAGPPAKLDLKDPLVELARKDVVDQRDRQALWVQRVTQATAEFVVIQAA